MKHKYSRIINRQLDEQEFWPSFTDLLTTILLVVLLLLMAVLATEQVKAEKREQELAEKEMKIQDQEELISLLTGVRQDIIEDLILEFENEALGIDVDKETGAIKFRNDLLFATASDEIRGPFKQELRNFIPEYFSIVYGKYGDHIADIVVEGHTDDVGSFMYNLELSQKRAFSVVRYILSDEFGDFPYKEVVRDNITANGRSESQLKFFESGEVDRDNSRRVEFHFRLKNYSDWNEIATTTK
ncbi:OmpA family protein [Bacillus salinus]|uniref:OmpA family protein n=1 Tax=Bacillus sp. HMF5848 TaxID=2495421 RepID=UPI00163B37EF|nr:OmpA family protein [Bacillus sp. HMF5848]